MLPNATTNPITVEVSAANIPPGTNVEIAAIPKLGPKTTGTGMLTGTTASSTATASVNIATDQVNVMAAQVTVVQTADLLIPDVNGERVLFAQVGSTLGGKSTLTYTTDSGKTYRAEEIGIWPMIRVDSRR
jgi:hypothetical protein